MRRRLMILCVAVATVAGPFVGVRAAQAATATTAPPAETDVALHTAAFAALTVNCTLGSGPQKAVDGAASNIYTDKWCSFSKEPDLTIPLPVTPAGYTVDKIVVKHAGVAESPTLNTRDFRLSVFNPNVGTDYKYVYGNTANVTTTPIGESGITEVDLLILTPTQTTNTATRIYEVEVWGYPTPPPCVGKGQQLVNPNFQLGQVGWNSSPNTIYNGQANLWSLTNDWLSQTVQLPATCTSVGFDFRIHIDTQDLPTGMNDKLTVQVNSSTVATYWDQDNIRTSVSPGYMDVYFDVSAYAGQLVTVRFSALGNPFGPDATTFHLYFVELWAS